MRRVLHYFLVFLKYVTISLGFDIDFFVFQNQWSTVFSGIVSRAMTLEVLSTGVAGNYNGALQVVHRRKYFFYQLNKQYK